MATKSKKQAMQVSVVVRVRPLLPHEARETSVVHVTHTKQRDQSGLVTLSPRAGSAEQSALFAFDKCYDAETPQRVLFQREIAQSVTRVLTGVNTTIFAYGPTGAGKTFTMEGSKKNLGMISRCVKQLFQVVADDSERASLVDLSYLEIYNDRICDLLVAKAQKVDLPIRQQVDGGIAVHGLTKRRIATLREFEELYEAGSAGRKKARTELNAESSRSHSILMLHVTTTDDASGEVRYGKLHLIDLAGCEDNRKTGNSGVRLAESGKINMSLFVLGKVISALNSGDLQRIPFRDSKLTRLLQDSLGGSSHAVMICNVSPIASMYQESLQTLTYASKARGIVNDVAINRTAIVASTISKKSEAGRRADLLSQPLASNVMLKSDASETSSRSLSSAPRQSVGSSRPMESKLAAWRKSRSSSSRTASNSAEVKAPQSKSTAGLKRKATTSIGEPRLTPTTSTPLAQQTAATSSWTKAVVNQVSKPPASSESKKSRFSILTPSVSSKVRDPVTIVKGARSSVSNMLPNKAPICTGSPTSDKENQPASAANAISEEEKPVFIAKKLIGLAIDLEKRKRFRAASCLFQRAYHVFPVKMVERMLLLEGEYFEAAATFMPSQQMETSAYVRLVMERDLLEILNSGSNDELLELYSIGDKRAERIVEARPFSQLSDLLRVQGIADNVLQRLHAQHTAWENPV